MAQYDPLVIKSGLAGVLGTDTLRADVIAHAGLTTTGLAAGDVVQVTANLTLSKAVNTSTSPIVGVYDGVTGSVVREGVVVATFKTAPTANGDAVYLSSTAGQLTTTKPTMDMVHEVGVVVDFATRKVLLQQKPVIALPATPPPNIWVSNISQPRKFLASSGAYIGTIAGVFQTQDMLWDGVYLWEMSSDNPNQFRKIDPVAMTVVGGPYTFIGGAGRYCCQFAFDGTNYWATHSWLGAGSDKIYSFNSTGTELGSWTMPSAPVLPQGCCYGGGTDLYVASSNYGRVYKWDTATHALGVRSDYLGGNTWYAGSLCWDGANIWVAMSTWLHKIRGSDMVVLASIDLAGGGWAGVTSVCYDGANVWAGCRDTKVYKVRCSDAAVLGSYSCGGGNEVFTVCFDGTHIWAGLNGTHKLRKLLASDGSFVGDYDYPGAYYEWIRLTSTTGVLPTWP